MIRCLLRFLSFAFTNDKVFTETLKFKNKSFNYFDEIVNLTDMCPYSSAHGKNLKKSPSSYSFVTDPKPWADVGLRFDQFHRSWKTRFDYQVFIGANRIQLSRQWELSDDIDYVSESKSPVSSFSALVSRHDFLFQHHFCTFPLTRHGFTQEIPLFCVRRQGSKSSDIFCVESFFACKRLME